MNCHRFAQAGTIVGTQARWDHKAVYDLIWGALPMIEDGFDARTLANMNVALETGLSAKAGRRGSQGTQARGSADHTVQVRAPKPLRTSCIFGIEAVSFCRALKIPDIVSRTWPWRQPAKLAYAAASCCFDVRPVCANRSPLSARLT